MHDNPIWSILFLLLPIFTIWFVTRKKTKEQFFYDPEWEPFRKITPFSTKFNFYLWTNFLFWGSIFLIIVLIIKILYDASILD